MHLNIQCQILIATVMALVNGVSGSSPTEVIDRTFQPRQIAPVSIESTKGHVRFDLNKSALIIIDMQVYFLKDAGAAGLPLVAKMNETIAAFRAAQAPVVWVNWGQRSDMRNFHVYGTPQSWTPPVHGTPDAEIFPGLDFDAKRDIVVEKFRLTGFYRTQLDDILRFDERRTLFFGGVNTDQCVFGTVQDAQFLGYDSFLVKDLCATSSPAFATQMVEFETGTIPGSPGFTAVVNASSLIQALSPSRL
jgi:nicotinamidase-related amidase